MPRKRRRLHWRQPTLVLTLRQPGGNAGARVTPPSRVSDDRTNGLFACLPDEQFEELQPHLQVVQLAQGQVLHRSGERPAQVYFPIGAVVSRASDSHRHWPATTLPRGSRAVRATESDPDPVAVDVGQLAARVEALRGTLTEAATVVVLALVVIAWPVN